MSVNPATQNIENLGKSAETLRLIFRALDLVFSRTIPSERLFQTGPRFNQSHLPAHHANSDVFNATANLCGFITLRPARVTWSSRGAMSPRKPCYLRPSHQNIVPSISRFYFCAPLALASLASTMPPRLCVLCELGGPLAGYSVALALRRKQNEP
jgi:hypothetical protein